MVFPVWAEIGKVFACLNVNAGRRFGWVRLEVEGVPVLRGVRSTTTASGQCAMVCHLQDFVTTNLRTALNARERALRGSGRRH